MALRQEPWARGALRQRVLGADAGHPRLRVGELLLLWLLPRLLQRWQQVVLPTQARSWSRRGLGAMPLRLLVLHRARFRLLNNLPSCLHLWRLFVSAAPRQNYRLQRQQKSRLRSRSRPTGPRPTFAGKGCRPTIRCRRSPVAPTMMRMTVSAVATQTLTLPPRPSPHPLRLLSARFG